MMEAKSNFSNNIYYLLMALIFITPASSAASLSMNIKELDSHLFSEEKLMCTIVIDHDFKHEEVLEMEWETSFFNRVLQKEKQTVTLQPKEQKSIQITINMPPTQKKGNLHLAIRLLSNRGKELLSTTYGYSVFPRTNEYRVNNRTIGLFDTKGNTRDILRKMNVSYQLLESELSVNTFEGDLIIIGAYAISQENQHLLQGLQKKINAGTSVLVLEQEVLPTPFPIQLSAQNNRKCALTRSEITAKGHKTFYGLSLEDLSQWRGDGTVARIPLKVCEKGNYRTLLSGISKDMRDGELFPLILEMPWGQGKCILSQMLQVDKYNTEPVAALLLVNLINYATLKSDAMDHVLVLGSQGNTVLEMFGDLGMGSSSDLLSIGEAKKIIICSDGAFADLIESTGSSFLYGLRNCIQNGGTLLVFNLIPEVADYLKILFPPDLQIVQPDKIAYEQNISINATEVLLWGISTGNIQALIDQYSMDSLSNALYFLDFKKSATAIPLMSPCAMAKFIYGTGNIVICQLPFNKDRYELTLHVISQLLTNLQILIPT